MMFGIRTQGRVCRGGNVLEYVRLANQIRRQKAHCGLAGHDAAYDDGIQMRGAMTP